MSSDKYKHKYRIPSARLQNWDYRWSGVYFITICTKNREHLFGEIHDVDINKPILQYSPIGIIADIMWNEIKNHARNIELGAFVVMPNHIHGILILMNNDTDNNVETGHALSENNMTINNDGRIDNQNVHIENETWHAMSLQKQPTIGQQRFQNIGKNSISSIVGSYKSAVTKHAHRLGYEFEWQTRFHEHVIRNDESFQKISEYIVNNPAHWNHDTFYKTNGDI